MYKLSKAAKSLMRLSIPLISLSLLYFSSIAWATNLPNGGKISDEIAVSGEIDEYFFSANAGETIYLRVADTETTQSIPSSFSPLITLISPSNAVLETDRGTLVAEMERALVETGTYRVLINDEGPSQDETGTYDIFYAKALGANEHGIIPNGGLISDEIDLGDLDSYTFQGNAGETVYIQVADTETTPFVSSPFTPGISLLDPTGARIRFTRGTLVASAIHSLVLNGSYTAVILDDSPGEDSTGSYDLYFAKAPGAAGDGCIPGGSSATGFIGLGDIDSFNFSASAGAFLSVTVTDLDDSSFSPWVALLSPSGSSLGFERATTTATLNRTLDASGIYTLIIRDDSPGDDETGNYRLDLSGSGIVCPTALCNGFSVTVDLNLGQTPGPGDDVVLGTSGADVIRGRSGNDAICGMGGADFIHGNSGDDWIDGGGGVDNIRGGQGSDILFSGQGATVGTNSRVFGGTGDDSIFGGPDDDDLRGGRGKDVIYGEQGADLISGNEDDDTLFGGRGADTISGGNGQSDELFGEAGNDSLNGGSGGNDFCDGGGQGGDTDTNCEVF